MGGAGGVQTEVTPEFPKEKEGKVWQRWRKEAQGLVWRLHPCMRSPQFSSGSNFYGARGGNLEGSTTTLL